MQYEVIEPATHPPLIEIRKYLKVKSRRGRWHIVAAESDGSFELVCGLRIPYRFEPEVRDRLWKSARRCKQCHKSK